MAFRTRQCCPLVGLEKREWFIGAEASSNQGKLNLERPFSRGTVTNWDHAEKIWHHTFYQVLHVAPDQHPLMMTDPPLSSSSYKEKVSQIMFETFNIPALYLANQGVLALYSCGKTTGMTIESGEGMTYFVPIFEGCPLRQSIMKLDIAGQDLTLYLLQLLSESGYSFVSRGDKDYAQDLKEKCCYVALDFEKELAKAQSPSFKQTFQLPDGQEVQVGRERFLCPEALFKPGVLAPERSRLSIHMAASQSISSCPRTLWKTLFRNILLAGGTGSCSGLCLRLKKEMNEVVSPYLSVKVSTCPYTVYASWIGGSILCSLSMFKDMWVTQEEYRDIGLSSISRRSL
ncbi:actin-like [Echinops telfairi]|uniref:Actin-like n=1 Tax=Echinops telfairi TaxID=9371 RepID=A0ABM0ZT31_ECHTE|nr:actin-like [Echinops telfairi]